MSHASGDVKAISYSAKIKRNRSISIVRRMKFDKRHFPLLSQPQNIFMIHESNENRATCVVVAVVDFFIVFIICVVVVVVVCDEMALIFNCLWLFIEVEQAS